MKRGRPGFGLAGSSCPELRNFRHFVSPAKVEAFTGEATSADYDNVIPTAMRWVEVV